MVGGSNSLSPVGLGTAYGLVDINLLSGFSIAVNGLTNPIWSIGPTGNFAGTFTIPGNAPIGSQRSFQALVADYVDRKYPAVAPMSG